MPWGPPLPLDHAGTTVHPTDRKVEIRHAAPPRRLAAAAVLVGSGPVILAAAVLGGWTDRLWMFAVAATVAMVGGLVVAFLRAQVVVTPESMIRWSGLGRARPEVVRMEAPTVDVRPPAEPDGAFAVVVHDRGEALEVAESRDRARIEDLADRVRGVLGVRDPGA